MEQREKPSTSTNEYTPGLAIRILHLTLVRVYESRETIAYTTTIILSTLLGIILEALIAVAHSHAIDDVQQSAGWVERPNSPFSHPDPDNGYVYVLINLQRRKDENVFFILFHVFQFYLGMDSIVRQRVIQLSAHIVNEFLCVILALVQLSDTLKWNHGVTQVDKHTGKDTRLDDFHVALRYEIALASVMLVFTLVFALLCYKLSRQFGWNTYKRLGADPKLQARFRHCQIFLLVLKLDGFFHIVFSVFWIVVMSQEGYQHGTPAAIAWYTLHFLLTALQFVIPFVARHAIRSEQPKWMNAFLVAHVLVVTDFVVVLQQSVGSWVFWVLAVCLAILLSIITIVLAIVVTRNFGKGLKPYVQRLFDKDYRYRFDPGANPTSSKQKQAENRSSWVIDEIEEDDVDSESGIVVQRY
ncbi:predicted protein [Lichtheimia corymbifera JMRC:FSU:9682]|uniref:Uncharacterized protein n=1 Tax=Lichtheimia corymbifera JMRC:FSU:9682 TaxID=1263082 RepID=A0A068RUA6_9FUNG|nr:predicted protein [Lichtheimia corymbifera JMRC:FSU:9682]